MRVTAETKRATRDRILDSARKLFDDKGFDQTTTRDIAGTARIATGTLFNYFPNKEAVAMTLFAEALEGVDGEFSKTRRGDESLEEDLFAHVLLGLSRLREFRAYVGVVIETTMSPLTKSPCCESVEAIRVRHLEVVADLLRRHTSVIEPSFVAVHLYWTLYMGAVAFWSMDGSPNQEDTLVLLDQSMRVYATSLSSGLLNAEVSHGA